MVAVYLQPCTYHNKGPVTEVVDRAEEPEFVKKKIGPCHSALV